MNTICLLLFTLLLAACMQDSPADKELFAIVRSDNDFVTYNDTLSSREALPAAVSKKINELFKPDTAHAIFRVMYYPNIDIYVFKSERPIKNITYHFLAFNKNKNQVSDSSVYINGKWMENEEKGFTAGNKLLRKPLIFFEDVNDDNHPEIIVRERVHNGNSYNAVVSKCFRIDANMRLQELLAVETILLLPDSDCLIVREFSSSMIRTNLHCGELDILIGKVHLDLKKDSIVQRVEVFDKRYKHMMVSGSEVPDNTFLKNGYNVYY